MKNPAKLHGGMIWLAVFAVAVLVVSACGGSSLQDDEDCGPHGEWVDGRCVCEPGYVLRDGTCELAAQEDGDGEEPADGDRPDGDKPDGDPDADEDIIIPPDGDPDTDGDQPVDGDQEESCYCPTLDAVFCVDPEIPNPANYQIVEIRPGTKPGCTIVVSVRTGLTVTVDEYRCAANERITLPSLGCTLFYAYSQGQVRMVCGDYQYTFTVDFCGAAPDGDADTDVDGDPEQDSDDPADGDVSDGDVSDGDTSDGDEDGDTDQDTDDPADGDVSDGDVDGDVSDGDVIDGDTDEEQLFLCTDDNQCEPYHYCDVTQSPWRCVQGCHPTQRPCQPGYTCTAQGLCEPAGGDGDEDFEIPSCTLATESDVCGFGYYCLILSGSSGQCAHDCWTNTECESGFECNVSRGRCERLGGCENDTQCPAQWFCNISGLCQQGCATSAQCGIDQTCNAHGRCIDDVVDGDTDQDVPCTVQTVVADCGTGYSCQNGRCYQECATTAYCLTNYGPSFICNEFGMCVADIICYDHDDCPLAGYPRHYCSNGMCFQDCVNDATCTGTFGPGFGCNEYGWCERVETDTDGGDPTCTMDTHCPDGTYCNTATNACISDCTSNVQCAHLGPTAYCDLGRGRCDANIVDGDLDTDTDTPVIIPCSTDLECPQYWYCQSIGGYCVDPCTLCPTNWDCVEGICTCDGDDCGPPTDGDFELEDINQPCTAISDCPPWYFCDEDGWCRQECITGCPAGQFCDMTIYRCVDSVDGDLIELPDTEDACLSVDDCPPYYYCDTRVWRCQQDCAELNDCGPGYRCTPRGQCEIDYAPCVHNAECAKGTFCDTALWYCAALCFSSSDCGPTEFCTERGQCVPNGTTPDPPQYPSCVYDHDCPNLSYCDVNICRTTCIPPNVGCAEGLVCDERGRCMMDVDGDIDGDVDIDEDEEQVDPTEAACTTLADCPYSSQCLTNPNGGEPEKTCQTECLMDRHCSGGLQCDCFGRCVTNLPDPSQCTGFRACLDNSACPPGTHCWDGFCRAECLIIPELGYNFGCAQYYMCDNRGYCVVDADGDQDFEGDLILCANDGDCPYHSRCFDPGGGEAPFCYATCTQHAHCPPGRFCDNRGNCVTSSGPWDDGPGYPACTVDEDCESWSYCTTGNYCRIDCAPPANLLCTTGTCVKGRCLTK